jgi:hypothetical protein
VEQIRSSWPKAKIIVRGDSGFSRENSMSWCEANGIDFVLGLAKNSRLLAMSLRARRQAQIDLLDAGEASRVIDEFSYQAPESWSTERRVVVKAEHLSKGANPHFVVTSLSAAQTDASTL